MRFLVLTLFGGAESRFYGQVTEELRRHGHECSHVTWSPRAARMLRRRGFGSYAMPDEIDRALPPGTDVEAEGRRIVETYGLRSLRDVYRTDPPCVGRPEAWCVERTVRHFLAMERILDEVRPDVVVPEVGSETMRTAAHMVAVQRGIDVLFLFYTIFDNPLRLYANTMHAPIAPLEDLRPLQDAEREEVETFIRRFTERDTPIRAYRAPRITRSSLRDFTRHVLVSLTEDRRNQYLRPQQFVRNYVVERSRAQVLRRFYEPLDDTRPFVYFPLHVTDDYKIKRVIPHCVDQASLIELVAASLPEGMDVVIKEHPMSIGRNSIGLLRRLAGVPNVRLVEPHTSSHELIRRSRAIAVISSTVGLEALLYGKPVMTLGQPFYSGFGVTLDVDSFRTVPDDVQELLRFEPDRERTLQFLHAAMRRCYPGKPYLVDASPENARTLAGSLHRAVSPGVGALV